MRSFRLLRLLGSAVLVAGAAGFGPATADIPAGNVLYTVGTTFTSGGQSHVYLLWMPTDDDLLRLRSYSVWSKAGAANAPGVFAPESWIEVQTDPLVIEGILGRAERLGQDLSKLEVAIDGLFEIFKPGGGLSRADKLSVILQGAQNDPQLFHDLLVLARLHPAVSICLGAAWTGPAGGLRTYEIRMGAPGDGPHAPDAARRVIGRVTLDPAAYQPLPAPGSPVSVPFGKWVDGVFVRDARSHLNARMRWATPDPLRQRSLLQFGYHVYRVDPAFYRSSGMDGGLQADDLPNYAQAFPDKVKRVSHSPVLIERMLDAAEAADQAGDPDTYFFIDDNGRFEPGGVPFNDGDEFQYMVTAVDVLGRDGLPSPATLFQICRTVGPNPPCNLTVRDQVTHPTSTTTRQVFGLSWQAPTPVPESPVDRYDIYRWVKPADTVVLYDPANPGNPNDPEAPRPGIKVGSVPAQPGLEWYSVEDASLGVPPPQGELNKPWWFTVQAVSAGACGDIVSPHGSPASGVLRDRTGPQGRANAQVVINTSIPRIQVDSIPSSTNLPLADRGHLNARIDLQRTSVAIDGADFYYRIDDNSPAGAGEDTPLGRAPVGATYLGSVRFKGAADLRSVTDYRIKLPDNGAHTVTFHLRSRDVHGNLSGFVMATHSSLPDDKLKEIRASASHSYRQDAAPVGVSNVKHVSRRADLGQIVFPLVYFQSVPADTEIWKLYRRIDLGPLVLAKEGRGSPPAQVATEALSANSGEVSYFLQLLDASGNAGPMTELGHFGMTPVEPPPQPMLLPVEALPGEQATLSWACPPHGVARFHVGVAAVGRPAPDTISEDLSTAFEMRAGVPVVIGAETVELDFRFYDSGPLLGNSSPEHAVTLDLEADVTYSFIVEAVSSSGERSTTSNLVSFSWMTPVDAGPEVTWPARPAPRINSAFKMPVASQEGIQIGNLSEFTSATKVGNTIRLRPTINLETYLFREAAGEREGSRPRRRLLPCVVYRYQVPNSTFPKVSGDVSQVTPLLRSIAARNENISGTNYTVVYDPYFGFDTVARKILLRVPHPLIWGATYRYLLVLFNDDGEIDSVVPTTTFEYTVN